MNSTIELWEQEIAAQREASIYNFYKDDNTEPVQEGIMAVALTGIGLYIAASIFIIVSIIVSSKKSEEKRKQTAKDLITNPKSKSLVEKALKNLQEFVYKNLPNNVRKYVIKKQDFNINEYNKNDNIIKYSGILEFDSDKLVNDLVDGNYKSVKDLITDGYEDDEKQSVLDNPDSYIQADNGKEYKKYVKFIDDMNKFTKEFNKKIKSIPDKYKTNISLSFEDMSYAIQYGMNPYFGISFNIPSESISSFTEEELKEIEKVSKIKLS